MCRLPVEAQPHLRVRFDLSRLVRFVIGEEHEPVDRDLFAQQGPHMGLTALVHAGHRHGIGLLDPGRIGLLEPAPELLQGGAGKARLVQRSDLVVDPGYWFHVPHRRAS